MARALWYRFLPFPEERLLSARRRKVLSTPARVIALRASVARRAPRTQRGSYVIKPPISRAAPWSTAEGAGRLTQGGHGRTSGAAKRARHRTRRSGKTHFMRPSFSGIRVSFCRYNEARLPQLRRQRYGLNGRPPSRGCQAPCWQVWTLSEGRRRRTTVAHVYGDEPSLCTSPFEPSGRAPAFPREWTSSVDSTTVITSGR